MAENERSYQAGGNNDFDGLPRICFTASQVASGNHCKTLETTVETSAWQPLALVTSRVNQRGNHWLGSHQVRVRGCEPLGVNFQPARIGGCVSLFCRLFSIRQCDVCRAIALCNRRARDRTGTRDIQHLLQLRDHRYFREWCDSLASLAEPRTQGIPGRSLG